MLKKILKGLAVAMLSAMAYIEHSIGSIASLLKGVGINPVIPIVVTILIFLVHFIRNKK